MKVSVTKRHITSAKRSEGRLTPIEVAVMDLDCFAEINLLASSPSGYSLEVDGSRVKLPRSVQTALEVWEIQGDMKPVSFDLPIEDPFLSSEDLLLDNFDEGLDLGYGFGYA
ncbi:MAG: hypothetical protein AAF587_23070 [Bacteroidota bacterium]